MTCKATYYSGAAECDAIFQKLVAFIVMDKGTAVSDPSALATWQAIIAPTTNQTGIYLEIENGYQNNTADLERNTNNLGFTKKTDDPNIALVGFGNPSFCNYKTLYDLDNKDVDFVGVTKDGNLWMTEDSNGNSIGFRADFTIRKNAPNADNTAEYSPYYIDFKYMSQMDNAKVVIPDFSLIELADAQPVGLSASVVTAYSAGVVRIQLVKRCTADPYTAATATTNWEILSQELGSTDTDLAITAVADGGVGLYDVTIKKDSGTVPADLTADVTIRAIDDDGSNLTYVSQPVLIKV